MSTARASASSIATPDSVPTVPQVGWYDLFSKRAEIIESCEAILIQLQRVLAQWKDQIPAITLFITNASLKIEALKQEHPGREIDSGPWNFFFGELKKCIAELTAFSTIASDKKNKTPQIIAAGVERIKMWPQLIRAFNNLELDLIVGGLFASQPANTVDAQSKGSFTLPSILPPYQMQQLQSSLEWMEKNLGESFSTLPQTLQDAILIMASEMNTLYRHAYLLLDKVAVQTGFDKNKLAHEPLFFKTDELEEKSSLITLSFHQLASRFRDLYHACMQKAGYRIFEEYYPFATAVLAQRLTFPLTLKAQWEKESASQHLEWGKARQECVDLIEAKIRQLESDESYFKSFFGRTSVPLSQELESLKQFLPQQKDELDKALVEHINTLSDKDTAHRIEAVYLNLMDRTQNRIAWFKQQEKNIQELIQLAEREAGNAPKIEKPVQLIQDKVINEMISEDAPKLAMHTQELIKTLTEGNADASSNIFDNILYAIDQCEYKLKEMLDESIYEEWFVKDSKVIMNLNFLPNSEQINLRIILNEAWLNELAQLIKTIRQLCHDAKFLQTKSESNVRAATIPAAHFKQALRAVDISVVSLNKVLQALNVFKQHPLIQALPGIGTMLANVLPTLKQTTYDTIIEPLLQNPLQVAWMEQENFASPQDKLQGGLQVLRKMYLSLIDQSDKDEIIKRQTVAGLAQADYLLDAFYQQSSSLVFILKYPRKIFRLIRNIADVFASLMTVSGDALLLAARQFNDALYNLFLLFDKLETQFYLKQGYLASLICINGYYLTDIAKMFVDMMARQGYEFDTEKNYPYHEAILQQRKALLAAAQDFSTQEFILQKVNTLQVLMSEKAASQVAINLSEQVKINKILHKTFEEKYKSLRLQYFDTHARNEKIKLLKRMCEFLQQNPTRPFKPFLQTFTSKEKALLRTGRTGMLLNSLPMACKQDLVDTLNRHLAQLHQQHHYKKSFFGSREHNKLIDSKVSALYAFRQYVILPGFKIADALKELKQHGDKHYQVLIKYQHRLLNMLGEIEKCVPEFMVGKKVIFDANKQPKLGEWVSPVLEEEKEVERPLLSLSRLA